MVIFSRSYKSNVPQFCGTSNAKKQELRKPGQVKKNNKIFARDNKQVSVVFDHTNTHRGYVHIAVVNRHDNVMRMLVVNRAPHWLSCAKHLFHCSYVQPQSQPYKHMTIVRKIFTKGTTATKHRPIIRMVAANPCDHTHVPDAAAFNCIYSPENVLRTS